MDDTFTNYCEACGSGDEELYHCQGCSCCQECCNCAESDCDCDRCIDSRESRLE